MLLPLIDKVILLEDEELDKLIEYVNPNFLVLGNNHGEDYKGNIQNNIKMLADPNLVNELSTQVKDNIDLKFSSMLKK